MAILWIQKPLRAFLVLGTAMALQGCVAVAVPIAAGGLIGERSLSNSGSAANELDPSVEVATASEAAINSDLAPTVPEPAAALPPATPTSADFNAAFTQPSAPAVQSASSVTSSDTANAAAPERLSPPTGVPVSAVVSSSEVVTPPPTELATPQGRLVAHAAVEPPGDAAARSVLASPSADLVRPLPTPVPSAREPIELSGINQFLSYANQRQIGSEEEPSAAMISDRVSLQPVKAQCGGISPTILIDLDPENGVFDPSAASRPPSGLARGLAQLRSTGVNVAWISGNGIERLDQINRVLKFSGLDIYNEDRVLLVRGPDDRKQTLREELAQISCLIAIAGDSRSDFDELYDYLKNPEDAQSLEPLIGDGWFLIPQPLL